jgi:hypothetical protein
LVKETKLLETKITYSSVTREFYILTVVFQFLQYLIQVKYFAFTLFVFKRIGMLQPCLFLHAAFEIRPSVSKDINFSTLRAAKYKISEYYYIMMFRISNEFFFIRFINGKYYVITIISWYNLKWYVIKNASHAYCMYL